MKGLKPAGLLVLLLPALAACSKKASDDAATASQSSATEGSQANTASTNRLCALYSTSEIKEILGADVGNGEAAGPMATACQWDGKGADGVYAQVQLIPGADNWEKHSGAQGYEVLPGIGKEAFVAMALGGWEAGTVTDKSVVFVSLNGGTASRNSAVAFLKKTMEKLGPSI